MTLYHDGVLVSSGLLSPWSTLPAVLGILALGAGAIMARRILPWLAFGVLFFLGGHALESTVIPLELVFEHRNYVPSFGLLAGVALQAAVGIHESTFRLQQAVLLGFGVLVAAMGLLTYQRASLWGDPPRLLATSLALQPHSPRVQFNAAYVFGQRCLELIQSSAPSASLYCDQARTRYATVARLALEDAGSLIRMVELDMAEGMPVDPAIDVEIRRRLSSLDPEWVNINVLATVLRDSASPIPAVRLANWAEAALRNPRQREVGRLAIHVAFSELLFNRMQLPLEAEKQLNSALIQAPFRIDLRLTQVQLKLALGDLNEAELLLDQVHNMPGAWAYSKTLQSLSDAILAARQ